MRQDHCEGTADKLNGGKIWMPGGRFPKISQEPRLVRAELKGMSSYLLEGDKDDGGRKK